MSVGGVPVDELTGAGATFIDDFKAKYSPDAVDPYTPYAAAAAEVLLKAIEASDGTRASVTQNLFGIQIDRNACWVTSRSTRTATPTRAR